MLSAIVALSLTTPAFAKTRVVQTRNGQAVVTTNSGNHRNHWRSDRWRSGSSVFWNVGIGLPFYGGYPYYGSSYYGGYPYGSYGYGYYPYGYGANSYYGSTYPSYYNRSVYRGYGDQRSRASRNGSPAPDIIVGRSMA